ncbi:Helicase conserved C-terminal domain-containing protein [Nocardia amikacinitolerans]|uniref:Helicase conserved C-terminal domain-containing protein n=1 Tax=Nocardia amikacinitolerans TaxID=756689 RepID=A0A285LU57_9NOCA|nr:helicase-related protein [Nocardia amikacinitolerans]SNY88459.1 Helicase conserved C-terminal domain-containing protein [Nocardia amikacinitolerans]
MNDSESALSEHRRQFVRYLRRQLVGPAGADDETLVDPPDRRYLMGTLYPRGASLLEHSQEDAEQTFSETAAGNGEEDRFADDPVAEANAWLPSSLGFSFFTDARQIEVSCKASRYLTLREGGRRSWQRQPRLSATVPVVAEQQTTAIDVLDGHGRLHIRWRPYGLGHLVTCVLANAHNEEESAHRDRDLMLFQAELEATTLGGKILEYPSTRLNSRDEEEQELRVQYRHIVTRAVGHGCAVVWNEKSDQVTTVRAQVMPEQVVEHIKPDGPKDLPVLNLAHLSQPELAEDDLRTGLHSFILGYRKWFETQQSEAESLKEWAANPAKRILERIDTVLERMTSGVEALTASTLAGAKAREAFRLANRAMALQMLHSRRELAGSRRRRGSEVLEQTEPDGDYAWHPFQLAYFLLVVESLMYPGSEHRKTVDLIWFPTGGGKTEAYLLTACFEILWRRLRYGPEGGGTAVLSRYTLSLLTTQQFQRTATAVCALEYIRRGHDGPLLHDLGDEPISIGLWVGRETTPNRISAAQDELHVLKGMPKPDDRFLLERCPWCGTEIVPKRGGKDKDFGIRADGVTTSFFCPRNSCVFHDWLPVSVVDEQIYKEPPTFVLGTVDKFARLAWEPDAGNLFGSEGKRAPSLVIQDELHLLAGPLGTTVGLYESAILELCAWGGTVPKIVASTATIRRSQDQIRHLYGRPAQLFPPAGINAGRSYFASPDEEKPGRLYVGVMAQGHTASTATIHVGAAALQAPMEICADDALRDAYWTVVAYHNSLRELGRTVTIARDDIPARLEHLTKDHTLRRSLSDDSVAELTSNIPRTDQPELLDRLGKSLEEHDSISFLATTNMLAVGVDVPRLGLMLMNGQPKTTSEYIQATSRVGRKKVPGLIVTLFRSTKPRDRSHYESFGAYHRSLYRHVEPTSVTPWSMPSRNRALHAVLTILVRHGIGLNAENKAGEILDHTDEVVRVRDIVVNHVRRADPEEADAAAEQLDALIAAWQQEAEILRGDGGRLYYQPQGRLYTSLLTDFGKQGGLWETPQSMRNVDRECLVAVRGTP